MTLQLDHWVGSGLLQHVGLCVFQADGDELLTLAKELNSAQTGSAKVEELDEALLKKLSFVAAGDLAPVNAFIGGLAAQEVMKVSLIALEYWYNRLRGCRNWGLCSS